MGWLFIRGASKADVIRNLTAPEENEARYWESIAHCVRGNVLWAVVEIRYKQENRRSKRFIACYLLERDGGEWGYKDMEESMHPYYYSCPLKYLDMAPAANEKWRAEVRKYHAERNRKFAKGQKVTVRGCASVPWVVIRSLRPLLGDYDGATYKLERRFLGEVIA